MCQPHGPATYDEVLDDEKILAHWDCAYTRLVEFCRMVPERQLGYVTFGFPTMREGKERPYYNRFYNLLVLLGHVLPRATDRTETLCHLVYQTFKMPIGTVVPVVSLFVECHGVVTKTTPKVDWCPIL